MMTPNSIVMTANEMMIKPKVAFTVILSVLPNCPVTIDNDLPYNVKQTLNTP